MTETMSMLDARARYYEINQFGADGGDSLRWVPIEFLGLTFYIPNTDGRRRAVRIHDLHHIVTGYQTDIRGESEIAAWELASGCWRWPAALGLNLTGLGLGVVIAPRRILRAWARGRHTRNLYTERQGIESPGSAGARSNAKRCGESIDHLLPRTVAETRAELGLDRPAPAVRVRDALAALALAIPMFGVVVAITPPLLVVALVAAAITWARRLVTGLAAR